MRRRTVRITLLIIGALSMSGCIAVLLGTGAAAGYAVSKDSVRNSFDLSKDFVYHHSLAVAKEVGFITVEDASHGLIRMNVGDANVTITVKPITKRAVELKVSARNQLLLPEIDVAQTVYTKIIQRLH